VEIQQRLLVAVVPHCGIATIALSPKVSHSQK
jgi:hypothetical protein